MKENLLLGKLGKYRGIEDMPCGVCHNFTETHKENITDSMILPNISILSRASVEIDFVLLEALLIK